MPSKITDAGSPPSEPRTNSAPARSAHVCNCSAAAARKVSPAAINTFRPWAVLAAPTLPIVVVFPTPLTPTNSHTLGDSAASMRNERSAPLSCCFMATRNASINISGVVMDFSRTRSRRGASSACARCTPTSARISVSSSSSHVLSSMLLRDRIPENAVVNNDLARPILVFKFGLCSASATFGCVSAMTSMSISMGTATAVAVTSSTTGLSDSDARSRDERREKTIVPTPNESTRATSANRIGC